MMRFQVRTNISSPKELPAVILVKDNWNDWHSWTTMFFVVYYDAQGLSHEIGRIKIGEFKLKKADGKPSLKQKFTKLGEEHFSLGQDISYYESLNELGPNLRDTILESLNDIAKNEDLLERAIEQTVTKESLLRSVSLFTVQGQFRRLAQGGAKLTNFHFQYHNYTPDESEPGIIMDFTVNPKSTPPSNIHVLVGKNGVGKTYLLNSMASSLLNLRKRTVKFGYFTGQNERPMKDLFAGVVFVSFSAFDSTKPEVESKDKTLNIPYSYIGLRKTSKGKKAIAGLKTPKTLCTEFADSIWSSISIGKSGLLRDVIRKLSADPTFEETRLLEIFGIKSEEDLKTEAELLFDSYSSGHKIVLLSLTRLVETVNEKTIVLIDEPEGHLHPPLLSAYIRALSDLLRNRNGVAIISTHSPVVLQEVPASCIWKLSRYGEVTTARRLEVESFGENVGILTREIFGLEVDKTGFHKILSKAVAEDSDYEESIERFGNQLGMEAKAILRGMYHNKTKNQ